MFSLIITIVGIALVVLLALVGLYYVSYDFKQSQTRAQATKLATQTQQIQAAIVMYQHDTGNLPSGLSDLTTNGTYLKSYTPLSVWGSSNGYIQTTSSAVGADVCLAFDQQRGIQAVPSCSDPAYTNVIVCCSQ